MSKQDITKCPKCGGPADNGHDRCYPPNLYLCTKCQAAPVEQTICLNPIHNEAICSQNQDFYTHKQEPVATVIDPYDANGLIWNCQHPPKTGTKLYTHPKEWVGLTDEEIETIRTTGNIWTAYDISKAIEAKLKEKNNG